MGAQRSPNLCMCICVLYVYTYTNLLLISIYTVSHIPVSHDREFVVKINQDIYFSAECIH